MSAERYAKLQKLSAIIFDEVVSKNKRDGARFLKRGLIGPNLLSYYPNSIRDIQHPAILEPKENVLYSKRSNTSVEIVADKESYEKSSLLFEKSRAALPTMELEVYRLNMLEHDKARGKAKVKKVEAKKAAPTKGKK